MMEINMQATLIEIQNLMHSSQPTFENVKALIISKGVDDQNMFDTLRKAFEQFTDSGAIFKRIEHCFRQYRSIWNPKRKIKLIFTTPGVVVSDGDKFLEDQLIGSLFYDEAHGIRNGVRDSKLTSHKTSKAFFRLSDRVRSSHGLRHPVFALSGTPIFNGHDDVISILKFIGQKPECDPGYFQDERLREQRLIKSKEKFFIRRLAIDVLDLPTRSMCTHFFHFSNYEVERAGALLQQLQVLSRLISDVDVDGKERVKIQNRMQALLTKMRQHCISEELITSENDPGQVKTVRVRKKIRNNESKEGKENVVEKSRKGPTKIDKLYDKAYGKGKQEGLSESEQEYILNTMENSTKLFHFIQDIYNRCNGRFIHKTDQMETTDSEVVIVTSEWVQALKLIALMIQCPTVKGKYLSDGFIVPELFMYHGQMSDSQKEEALKGCKQNSKAGVPTVLLLSFHAGNTGLNLVFSRCIMILEGWWNKALMDQMAKRVHRNGQTKTCDIHQYVIEGTIEQHILWLQDKKHFDAMTVYGSEKEKHHAKQQKDMRAVKAKGFKIKEAVNGIRAVRQQYAQQTQNWEKLEKGFRHRVEEVDPDKDIRTTHTLHSLPSTSLTVQKPVKPRKPEVRKRCRDEWHDVDGYENNADYGYNSQPLPPPQLQASQNSSWVSTASKVTNALWSSLFN
jgi:SNF2 family DNA or RNA helicase